MKLRVWVRIQKPVVIYDLGKFRVTHCARLPNYFKINLLYNCFTFLILFAFKYCSSTSKMTMTMSAMFYKIGKLCTINNIWHCCTLPFL
jgi:hypothetical protein